MLPPTAHPLVIYHADCLDGFAAAWAAYRKYHEEAIYLPLHHGEAWDESLCDGREVVILDFSFAPELLCALAARARSITQLDHHQSARQPWLGRLHATDSGLEEYRHPRLPLFLRFAGEQSGARLAWNYFHPGEPLPLLLQHVEDVDLWRFALPASRAITRSLRLLPFDLAIWEQTIADAASAEHPAYRQLQWQGEAIEHFIRREVDRLADSPLVRVARLRGEPCDPMQAVRHGQETVGEGDSTWLTQAAVAINCDGLFASELGHELARRHARPALIWQLTGDGTVRASLRAVGDCDVAVIASRYGGGGHRHAAGFRLPAAAFFREVLGLEASGSPVPGSTTPG